MFLLPSECPNSDARVKYALYIFSRRDRSFAYCITGMYEGKSNVISHGPSSAVAPSSPLLFAD